MFTIKFKMAPYLIKPKGRNKKQWLIRLRSCIGIRVLIVEDNEINAGILRSFLLKWEVRTKEAGMGYRQW